MQAREVQTEVDWTMHINDALLSVQKNYDHRTKTPSQIDRLYLLIVGHITIVMLSSPSSIARGSSLGKKQSNRNSDLIFAMLAILASARLA